MTTEILSALKDVIKFKLIQQINTGDKTFDNILNVFIVSVLNFIFVGKIYLIIVDIFNKYFRRFFVKDTDDDFISNWKFYADILENEKIGRMSWNIGGGVFHIKLMTYIQKMNFKWLDNYIRYVDEIENNGQRNEAAYLSQILNNTTSNLKPVPIYKCNFGIVGIQKDKSSFMCLIYTSEKAIEEFTKFINSFGSNDEKPTAQNQPQKILYIDNSIVSYKSGEIFPDKTFNVFISKHKSILLPMIDTFIKTSETGKSTFNGFGTYNLGILLCGPPGSGKTTFIKALSNYVKRDVWVVNSRDFTKRAHIRKLFETAVNKIIVFEEFDCMQGAIKRELIDTTDKKDMLNNRYLMMLEMLSKAVDVDSRKKINDDLKLLSDEIKDVDNYVTTDVLLTEMDGLAERRGGIIIADTNHPEKIDPALLREGRIDIIVNLTFFTKPEIVELLEKMFQDDPHFKMIRSANFKENVFTPAKIINIVFKERELYKVIEKLC